MPCRSIIAFALSAVVPGKLVDFEKDMRAVSGKNNIATHWANGRALNASLKALQPGDEFVVPNKTFYVMGGIRVDNLTSVTLRIDGTIKYSNNEKEWPRDSTGKVLECLHGEYWKNVTLTSSHAVGGFGTFDGSGGDGFFGGWWGVPPFGSLSKDNRPRLFKVAHGKDILIEKIFLKDSPFWTFWFTDVDGLEVRHSKIEARRTKRASHRLLDLSAWNTDGFDITGRNVWIHDSEIWNQDDCIAVKDANPSENMLFERITASGLGMVIGSIGGNSHIRNITFRDIYMPQTYKGIYMKFRTVPDGEPSIIEDVTFENIVMDEPEQYPIWVGPAQQNEPSPNICAAHPCSLCWPQLPGQKCNMSPDGIYRNLTFRNITINSPKSSTGVMMGSATIPMTNVVFEDVKVNNPGSGHWGIDYYTEGFDASTCVAKGSTFPIPKGFKDETTSSIAV